MDGKKIMQDDQALDLQETNFNDDSAETTLAAELKKLSPSAWREQALEDYFNCCLCGQELHYTHTPNFIRLEVVEEAYCPSCNIKTKSRTHRLH